MIVDRVVFVEPKHDQLVALDQEAAPIARYWPTRPD
jgi:hypothetical protein